MVFFIASSPMATTHLGNGAPAVKKRPPRTPVHGWILSLHTEFGPEKCCEMDRGLPLGFVLVGLRGQCILECPPLLVSLVNILPFASGQGVNKSEI